MLEVLIAMALLVILSTALYGTYFSLIRSRETAVTKMEGRRELSTTLDQLRRELSAAFFDTRNTSQEPKLHLVVEDRDIFGKPASTLDFTTIAPPRSDSLNASDQVRIVYKVMERNNKLLLVRQAQNRYIKTEPMPYPQMEELEGFLVECSSDGKWDRNWDSSPSLNGKLPQYVRVTITVKEGEKSVGFSTVAKIRMSS